MNESQAGPNNLLDTTDCLEAVGVFKGWKNFLFIIVLLCLLLLQVSFWLVDTGCIEIDRQALGAEPAVKSDVGQADEPSAEPVMEEAEEITEPVPESVMEEPVEQARPEEIAEPQQQAEQEETVEPEESAEPEQAVEPEESDQPEEPAETEQVDEPEEMDEPEEAVEPNEVVEPNEADEPNEPAEEVSGIIGLNLPLALAWPPTELLSGVTFGQLSWVIRITNAVLILTASLYCLSLLFSLKVSMLGRLGGINHISRAFFLSLLMLILLLPWQRIFGSMVPGAIFTPEELVKWTSAEHGDMLDKVIYYLRFSGYWLLILLLLILSQIRSIRWGKAILRRLEII